MQKARIQKVVDDLPDDVDVDAFLERLYLLRKLEQAERQFATGQEIPHEEIEREFKECLD